MTADEQLVAAEIARLRAAGDQTAAANIFEAAPVEAVAKFLREQTMQALGGARRDHWLGVLELSMLARRERLAAERAARLADMRGRVIRSPDL
jgi:endonuclease I